jgi:hypothetical protein
MNIEQIGNQGYNEELAIKLLDIISDMNIY